MFISLLIAVDVEVLLPEPLVVGFVDVDLCPVVTSSANCHGVCNGLGLSASKIHRFGHAAGQAALAVIPLEGYNPASRSCDLRGDANTQISGASNINSCVRHRVGHTGNRKGRGGRAGVANGDLDPVDIIRNLKSEPNDEIVLLFLFSKSDNRYWNYRV